MIRSLHCASFLDSTQINLSKAVGGVVVLLLAVPADHLVPGPLPDREDLVRDGELGFDVSLQLQGGKISLLKHPLQSQDTESLHGQVILLPAGFPELLVCDGAERVVRDDIRFGHLVDLGDSGQLVHSAKSTASVAVTLVSPLMALARVSVVVVCICCPSAGVELHNDPLSVGALLCILGNFSSASAHSLSMPSDPQRPSVTKYLNPQLFPLSRIFFKNTSQGTKLMLLRFRLETRANSVVCSRTGYKTTFWAEIMHNCQFPPLLAEVSTGLWTQEAISSSLFKFMQTQHTQNLQSLTLQLVIQDFTRVAAGEKQMICFSPTSSLFLRWFFSDAPCNVLVHTVPRKMLFLAIQN